MKFTTLRNYKIRKECQISKFQKIMKFKKNRNNLISRKFHKLKIQF